MPREFCTTDLRGKKNCEALFAAGRQRERKFANSSRIHEDVDATSGRGTETISVVLPRSFVEICRFHLCACFHDKEGILRGSPQDAEHRD